MLVFNGDDSLPQYNWCTKSRKQDPFCSAESQSPLSVLVAIHL